MEKEGEKLALVKNIREVAKTQSKWDVTVKGQTIRLVIDPCHCGVHAKWVQSVKISSMLPPGLKDMLGQVGAIQNANDMVDKVIEEWHWNPNWWQKFFKVNFEPYLMKWIKRSHQEWHQVIAAEARAERLRAMVEQ